MEQNENRCPQCGIKEWILNGYAWQVLDANRNEIAMHYACKCGYIPPSLSPMEVYVQLRKLWK